MVVFWTTVWIVMIGFVNNKKRDYAVICQNVLTLNKIWCLVFMGINNWITNIRFGSTNFYHLLIFQSAFEKWLLTSVCSNRMSIHIQKTGYAKLMTFWVIKSFLSWTFYRNITERINFWINLGDWYFCQSVLIQVSRFHVEYKIDQFHYCRVVHSLHRHVLFLEQWN